MRGSELLPEYTEANIISAGQSNKKGTYSPPK